MSRDLNELKPKTLDGIKNLATGIKKRDGIKHHEALELAAKQAGYQNYRHAQNVLSATTKGTSA